MVKFTFPALDFCSVKQPHSAQDQKDGSGRGSIIHSTGSVRDLNVVSGSSGDVHVVVAGTD